MVENNNILTPNPTPAPTPAASPAPRADFTSPAAGDITLAHPTKKSKKPLIITICTISIIAIIFVVVLVLAGSSNNMETVDSKTAFARFSNYIISRKVEDIFPDQEYNRSDLYAVEIAMAEHDVDFFIIANQLLADFFETIPQDVNNNFETRINYYKKDFDIIAAYGNAKLADKDMMIEYFISNGSKATQDLMNIEHKNFTAIDNEEANNIAEKLLVYEEYLLDVLNLASDSGCINNHLVDTDCSDALVFTTTQLSQAATSLAGKNSADREIRSITESFLYDCWDINEELTKNE